MSGQQMAARLAVQEAVPELRHSCNHLLQALPAVEFEALQPHLQSIDLVRETVLIEAGAPLTHVYLPESGIISMMVRLSEGQTIELAMTGRDSVVGAVAPLGDAVASSDATVLLSGSASIIDVASFRAAVDRSVVLRTLLARHQQALFAHVQQSAACNASHSVEERLSRWLLRARDLCDRRALPLTQELLARMIGVQRNSVSIVAHGLQQAGIIHYNRGHIEIDNPESLEATACHCYRAVKARQDQLLKPPERRHHSHS